MMVRSNQVPEAKTPKKQSRVTKSRRSPINWDHRKDKQMLLQIFDQMNITTCDFKQLLEDMGRDQYTVDALKKRFKYLGEMATEVREDRLARAAEAEDAADCSALMYGARHDSDDEDVVHIREAIARDPLTPPPSEASPTIQSKRHGGQNARETITSTTHISNPGHHARDDNIPRQTSAVSNSDKPRTSAGDSWRPQNHGSPGWSRNPPCGPHGEPRGRSPPFRPQAERRSQNQDRWRGNERNKRWSFPGQGNRSKQTQQVTRVEVNHGPVHRVHHYFNN